MYHENFCCHCSFTEKSFNHIVYLESDVMFWIVNTLPVIVFYVSLHRSHPDGQLVMRIMTVGEKYKG